MTLTETLTTMGPASTEMGPASASFTTKRRAQRKNIMSPRLYNGGARCLEPKRLRILLLRLLLQLQLQHQLQLQLEKAMQGYGMQGMHVQCKATVAYVRHACATHACAMQGMHVTCEMQGYNTACKATVAPTSKNGRVGALVCPGSVSCVSSDQSFAIFHL